MREQSLLSASAIAILLLTTTWASADSRYKLDGGYYERSREGWFWYDDPPEEEEEEEEEYLLVLEPAQPDVELEDQGAGRDDDGPPVFSVAWMREQIPAALERAIDDPGEGDINVIAYAYLQRLMLERASEVSERYQRVVLQDPILDQNSRVPITSAANRAYYEEYDGQRAELLKWIAERAGLFYFFDTSCAYCQTQLPALSQLAERHGFEFMNITVDGKELPNLPPGPVRVDHGHAKKFQVARVPALVLVVPPDNAAIVAQGVTSRSDLERRIVSAARHTGLVTREMERELMPHRQRDIRGEDLKYDEEIDPDDPRQWINHIRRNLGYPELEG